jgi:hypothetical protein
VLQLSRGFMVARWDGMEASAEAMGSEYYEGRVIGDDAEREGIETFVHRHERDGNGIRERRLSFLFRRNIGLS